MLDQNLIGLGWTTFKAWRRVLQVLLLLLSHLFLVLGDDATVLFEVLKVRVRLVPAVDVFHDEFASFVNAVLLLLLTACEANGA